MVWVANTLIRILVILLYYWEVQARYSTTIAVVSLLGIILVAVAVNAGDSDSEPPRPRGMIVVSQEEKERLQEQQRQGTEEDVDPGTWDSESGSYSWEEDSS